MFLEQIEVLNFRNLSNQVVNFSSPITLVVGENGQGKTSLIEAAYLLSQAKSFRSARAREFVRFGCDEAEISGRVTTIYGHRKVTYKVISGRSKVFVEDKRITSAEDFYGSMQAISFVPSDLELVSGPSKGRRQFIDRTLSMMEPAYVKELVSYERALRNRAVLLKNKEASAISLEPWNELLIRHGSKIARHRQAFINEIAPLFESIASDFIKRDVKINFLSGFLENGLGIPSEKLRKKFFEIITREIASTRNLFGVHRDELEITLIPEDKPAREFASQGQTRALALALKVASLRIVEKLTSTVPILLLDDVESELDSERRKALSEIIKAHKGQVIITSTSAEGLSISSDAALLRVRSGVVSQASF